MDTLSALSKLGFFLKMRLLLKEIICSPSGENPFLLKYTLSHVQEGEMSQTVFPCKNGKNLPSVHSYV